jgi:AhpD family alkylhydroperoxidase
MPIRLDHFEAAPEWMNALGGAYDYVARSGLDGALLDLVYLRVSQINGCTFCADVHSRHLWKRGIGMAKLVQVALWRDAGPLFDERERTALAWAEAVTDIADTRVPDADYAAARSVFSEKELADLTIAIGLINAYNRLAVSFRATPAAVAVH